MAFKFVFAVLFVGAASAGYAPVAYQTAPVSVHAAPLAVAQKVVVKSEEYDPHPQYKYTYGVEDKLTGDSKSQVEERDGDVVRGEYSLIDADGYKRTVQYTADDHNGFNAVVHREPLVKSVVATPDAHYASPTVVKTVAPAAHYSAPVAHYSAPSVVRNVASVVQYAAPSVSHYSAPVAHYAAPTVVNYASPAVVKSAQLSYAAPPAQYTSYAAPAYTHYYH